MAYGKQKPAELKLRLQRPLHRQLTAQAKKNGCSLNAEIVQRLSASLADSAPIPAAGKRKAFNLERELTNIVEQVVRRAMTTGEKVDDLLLGQKVGKSFRRPSP